MEAIKRNVRDIQGADRQALEHLVGRQLCDDQQVVINVVGSAVPASDEAKEASAAPDVPAWWRIYEGLSDQEIERLDQAIRKRADLSRVFE